MRTEKADQEAFRAAVIADKKKGVSKTSPYTLGFTGQVRALTLRQFQQKVQDKFQLYTSFSLSVVCHHLPLYEPRSLTHLSADSWFRYWGSLLQFAPYI
jgi:hypothetical protein